MADDPIIDQYILRVYNSLRIALEPNTADPQGNFLRKASRSEIERLKATGYDSVLTLDAVNNAVTLLCRDSGYGNGDGAFINTNQLTKLHKALGENKPEL